MFFLVSGLGFMSGKAPKSQVQLKLSPYFPGSKQDSLDVATSFARQSAKPQVLHSLLVQGATWKLMVFFQSWERSPFSPSTERAAAAPSWLARLLEGRTLCSVQRALHSRPAEPTHALTQVTSFPWDSVSPCTRHKWRVPFPLTSRAAGRTTGQLSVKCFRH